MFHPAPFLMAAPHFFCGNASGRKPPHGLCKKRIRRKTPCCLHGKKTIRGKSPSCFHRKNQSGGNHRAVFTEKSNLAEIAALFSQKKSIRRKSPRCFRGKRQSEGNRRAAVPKKKKGLSAEKPKAPDCCIVTERFYAFFCASSTATAQATVAPTIGLLPMPIRPIISTCAGTEEEPANCASPCIRPMESVRP